MIRQQRSSLSALRLRTCRAGSGPSQSCRRPCAGARGLHPGGLGLRTCLLKDFPKANELATAGLVKETASCGGKGMGTEV